MGEHDGSTSAGAVFVPAQVARRRIEKELAKGFRRRGAENQLVRVQGTGRQAAAE